MAAIVGLEALNRPCEVELYSDSKYLVDAFNQHWIDSWLKKNWVNSQKKPVKNPDLWKRLSESKRTPSGHSLSGSKAMTAMRRTSAAISWQPQQLMETD